MQRQFFNVVGKLRRKAVFAFLIFFVISSIFTPAGVNLNTLQTELLTAHAALPAGQHCLAAGQDISNLVTDVNDCTQNHNGTIEGGSTGSSSNLQPGELGNCTDPTTSQVTTKVPQSNCSSPKQWVPIAGTTGGNKSDTSGCGLTSGWDLCISDLVYLVAVALPTYFLQIADFLLSLAVNLALQSTTYALSFLSQAWTVTRDLANMGFLFILIYIAFQIMWRAETGSTLATLGMVVAMALVVNFSFFFTRVVIDAGNIAAIEIYNNLPGSTTIGDSINGISPSTHSSGVRDLSDSIMSMLNVQKLLDTQTFQTWQQLQGTNPTFSIDRLITLSSIYIGIGIISIILAFAFLIAAVQFIGRIVMLWFAIVASPLAFAAQAMPGQQRLFRRWLQLLVRNAFYPAIFLFMFLFVVVLSKALSSTQGNIIQNLLNQLASTSAAQSSFLYQYGINVAMIAIELGLIVVMIKYALEYSERFASESATYAHRASQWVGDQYFNRAVGLAGFAGRQTLGRAGMRISQSEGLKNAASKNAVARTLLSTGQLAATSSYDVRGAKLGRQTLSTIGVRPGTVSGRGGRQAEVQATAAKRVRFAQTLRTDEITKAKRANDEISKDLIAKEATARQKQKEAQDETSRLTETIRKYTSGDKTVSKNEYENAIERRKQIQASASAYAADAEKAKNERLSHVENRGVENQRAANYADALEDRRVGNLGLPSQGSIMAAGRIRAALPAQARIEAKSSTGPTKNIPAATLKPANANNPNMPRPLQPQAANDNSSANGAQRVSRMPTPEELEHVTSRSVSGPSSRVPKPQSSSTVPGYITPPGGVLMPETETSSRGIKKVSPMPTAEDLQKVAAKSATGPSSAVTYNVVQPEQKGKDVMFGTPEIRSTQAVAANSQTQPATPAAPTPSPLTASAAPTPPAPKPSQPAVTTAAPASLTIPAHPSGPSEEALRVDAKRVDQARAQQQRKEETQDREAREELTKQIDETNKIRLRDLKRDVMGMVNKAFATQKFEIEERLKMLDRKEPERLDPKHGAETPAAEKPTESSTLENRTDKTQASILPPHGEMSRSEEQNDGENPPHYIEAAE